MTFPTQQFFVAFLVIYIILLLWMYLLDTAFLYIACTKQNSRQEEEIKVSIGTKDTFDNFSLKYKQSKIWVIS